VETVFRVAALSVFVMFFVVLFFFREPRKPGDVAAPTFAETGKNFLTVITNPKFMLFLLIFTGYWIGYWQEFITLPLYVHDYIDPKADTERMLSTGPFIVIALTVAISVLLRGLLSFRAVVLGTLISAVGWIFLAVYPTVWAAYAALAVVALGEIIQAPRYYDYISRLAPEGQQGTYMGFAFLPIGLGSFLAGGIGGKLMHYFGEVLHQPQRVWWAITAIGVLTALLLWIYDRVVMPGSERESS